MEHPILFCIFSTLATFAYCHIAIVNFGNRMPSMYYESFYLLKKTGLLNLIYFKPKHFHRFNIWEVIFFFSSYVCILVSIVLILLTFLNMINPITCALVSGAILSVLFLFDLIRVIIIDIQFKCEEKYYKNIRSTHITLIEKMINSGKKHSKQLECILNEYNNGTLPNQYGLMQAYQRELKEFDPNNSEGINQIDNKYIILYQNYKKAIPIKKIKGGTYKFELFDF